MAKGRLGGVFRDVQTLLRAGTTGGLTDGQLLEEFRTRGGEARERAFASLVERHGPAVLRLPFDPARRARGGGCLPGRIPRPGAQGRLVAGEGLPGPLAAPGRLPGRLVRAGLRGASEAARADGRRDGRSIGPRPGSRRPGPAHPRGDRPAARAVPRTDRALLPGGPDAGAGGGATALAPRDAAEPVGAGARTASRAADPPGRGALGGPGRLDSFGKRRGRSYRPRWRARRPGRHCQRRRDDWRSSD